MGLYVKDIGSRHPWAEAILSLCCVVGFGAFTIMAAIQAGTAQYGAVWAVFAGVVLIPTTIAGGSHNQGVASPSANQPRL